MNYQLYVMAAYSVAFVIIGVMFGVNYRRYRKMKQKFAAGRVREES